MYVYLNTLKEKIIGASKIRNDYMVQSNCIFNSSNTALLFFATYITDFALKLLCFILAKAFVRNSGSCHSFLLLNTIALVFISFFVIKE